MFKFIKTFETFVPKKVSTRDAEAKMLKILPIPPEHILIDVKSINIDDEKNSKWTHDKNSLLSFFTQNRKFFVFPIEDAQHYSTTCLNITHTDFNSDYNSQETPSVEAVFVYNKGTNYRTTFETEKDARKAAEYITKVIFYSIKNMLDTDYIFKIYDGFTDNVYEALKKMC